jgi:hypothetical protein
MCPNCFPAGFPGFPSYWEYDSFASLLQQKLEQQHLQPVPADSVDSYSLTHLEQLYHCATCDETWAFSSPDNAWRGYFLPLATADQYCRELRCPSLLKPGCGLPMLLGIAAYLLWQAFR